MISLGVAVCVDGVITDGMFSVHLSAPTTASLLLTPSLSFQDPQPSFLIFPGQIWPDWSPTESDRIAECLSGRMDCIWTLHIMSGYKNCDDDAGTRV